MATNLTAPVTFIGRHSVRVLAVVALATALLIGGLPARDASAATVGNCDTVASYPQLSYGKIRWAGMSQCFAMLLEHGYAYTITVDAGHRSYAQSQNYYEPLGDSVLLLYKSTVPGVSVNDPYNAGNFSYIGMNDDYAAPAHLGSRISYEVTGSPGMHTLFVARVSGFNQAVGTYSISVTRSVQVNIAPCVHVFAC